MPAEKELIKQDDTKTPAKPVDNKQKPGQKGKKTEEDELSPEDLQLKEDLALLVERAQSSGDPGVQKLALDSLDHK